MQTISETHVMDVLTEISEVSAPPSDAENITNSNSAHRVTKETYMMFLF